MAKIERLLEIMARLRDPECGCAWDVEQSFETIAPYTIEEAYEVDDAIRRADLDDLCSELGDLLLQVVFHAQMASEQDAFAFDDVVERVCDKLVRRHPHVFGDADVATSEAQVRAWEAQKERERRERAEREGRPASVVDDVPAGLPALLRAAKLQRRAERAGLDAGAPVELPDDRDPGDWLFACARAVALTGVEPETALREANARFEARVRDGS